MNSEDHSRAVEDQERDKITQAQLKSREMLRRWRDSIEVEVMPDGELYEKKHFTLRPVLQGKVSAKASIITIIITIIVAIIQALRQAGVF